MMAVETERDNPMTKAQALPYVSYAVDDALNERNVSDMPANARLVGWQCGFEPLFVAVWSYLGNELDDSEAEENRDRSTDRKELVPRHQARRLYHIGRNGANRAVEWFRHS